MDKNKRDAIALVCALVSRKKELGKKKIIDVTSQEFKEYRRLVQLSKFVFNV